MKKTYIYIALLLAVLLPTTSCSLDVDSPSAMDEDVIFSTIELAEGAIMGITVSFAETKSYRGRFLPFYGLNTDLEYYNSSDKYPEARAALAVYGVNASNTRMNEAVNAWAKMYEGIERANLAIRGLENSGLAKPGTDFGHLLAEAIALRAVLYLDLTRAWGDVPARFSPLINETIDIPKSDRDIIYKQLIDDLGRASELAFWPNEHRYTLKNNRINKAFIKALRAKICMVAAGYAQRPDSDAPRLSNDPELTKEKLYPIAERELLSLYENPNQAGKMDDSFENVFRLLCQEDLTAGKESLWQIPFSSGRGQMAYTFAIRHQAADQYTAMAQGGSVGPTFNLFYDYDVDDLRRDVTCIPYKWSASGTAVQELKKYDYDNWNFGKYRFEWMNRRVTSDNDDGLNKQYMRFAEVVLMLAEIKNELENANAAAPYLKALRERAFPADKHAEKVDAYVNSLSTEEKMFEAIVDEHAFEFAGEMLRKEALIRWNLLGKKVLEAKDRMYELRELTGRYTDVPSELYVRNVEAFPGDVNKEKIEIYGLNRGEFDAMPQPYKKVEWIKAKPATDPDKKIDALYKNDPDKYQFWPIWQVFIDNSNGKLKNDYGY